MVSRISELTPQMGNAPVIETSFVDSEEAPILPSNLLEDPHEAQRIREQDAYTDAVHQYLNPDGLSEQSVTSS